MKLEVGMYVRTKYSISKIENISPNEYDKEHDYIELENFVFDGLDTQGFFTTDEIKNASYNIIDLIEVGDIITFKDDEDVYRIISIPVKEIGTTDFYLAKNYDGKTEDIFVRYEYMKNQINSIVTKEMFSSMEYKVGE